LKEISANPNEVPQRLGVAQFLSKRIGIPLGDAYQSAEKIAAEWFGDTKITFKEAAKRIGNSIKDAGLNNEINSIYSRTLKGRREFTDTEQNKVDELTARLSPHEERLKAFPDALLKGIYDLGYVPLQLGGAIGGAVAGEVADRVAEVLAGEAGMTALGLRPPGNITLWAEDRIANLWGSLMGASYRGFIEAGMDRQTAAEATAGLLVVQAALTAIPISQLPGIKQLGQQALMKAATRVILKGGYQKATTLTAKRVAGMAAQQVAFGVIAAGANVVVNELAIEVSNMENEKKIPHGTWDQWALALGLGAVRGGLFATMGIAGAIKEGGAIYEASQSMAVKISGEMARKTAEAQAMRAVPGGKPIGGPAAPTPAKPGAVATVPKPIVSRETPGVVSQASLPPEIIPKDVLSIQESFRRAAEQMGFAKPGMKIVVEPRKPIEPPPTPAQMALVNPPRALEEPGPRVETTTELVSKPSAATAEPGAEHVDPDFLLTVHEAGEQPIGDIGHDPALENFKEGANAKGVVEELGGEKYNRTTTGPILVFEKLNGERIIASGRHRLDLALRKGETMLPTQIIREADGWTLKQAALADAMANIRDEKGSVRDYAELYQGFKLTPEEAKAKGLLGNPTARQGYSIGSYASDDLYSAFRNGTLPRDKVAAIANGAPHDEEVQAASMRAAKGMKADELENYTAGLAYMKKQGLTGGDETQPELFKVSRKLESELKLEARTASAKTGAMERELQDLKRARKMGEAERASFLKQYGFEAGDRDAMLTRVTELETELQRWDHWEQDPILHNQIREEAGLPPMQFRPAEELIEPAAIGEPSQPELMGTAPAPEQPPEPPREIQAPLPGMEALVSIEDQIRAATPPEAFQAPPAPPEKTSVLDFFKLDPKNPLDVKIIALQGKLKSQSTEPLTEARAIADAISDDNSLNFPVERIQRVREISERTALELTGRDDADLAAAVGTAKQLRANASTIEIDGVPYPLKEGRNEISHQLRKTAKPLSKLKSQPGLVEGVVGKVKNVAHVYLNLQRKWFLDVADLDKNGERGSFYMTVAGNLLRKGEGETISLLERFSAIPKNFLKENGIPERRWIGETRAFKVAIEGQDVELSFTRDEIMAMRLHMQTRDNQQALLEGFTLPFSKRKYEPIMLADADIKTILDSMSELEIKATENARDAMDVMRPLVAEVYERVFGRPMGNPRDYWPMHHTQEGKGIGWKDAADSMMANDLMKGAGIDFSHTIERTPAESPIILRGMYADLNDYMNFAANFIAKAEDLIAAKKVLWDSEISAIISARFGKDRLDNLQRGLQRSSGLKNVLPPPEAMAEAVRRMAVVRTIGAYLPTIVKSMFDSYRSIPYLGFARWLEGAMETRTNRGMVNRFLNERSPKWREAKRSGASRERVDVLAGGQTKVGGKTKPIARVAMWGQQKVGLGGIRTIVWGGVQSFLFEASRGNLTDDMITFTGLHPSDLEKMTADEKLNAATRFGEAVWEHTTASGLPETQSAMYHSSFLGRAWSTFSSDMNAIYNMIQERIANAKRIGGTSAWVKVGEAFLIAFVAGPILMNFIDEARRKALGQKPQPIFSIKLDRASRRPPTVRVDPTDYIASISSLIYGGGTFVQGILQVLRYGPGATPMGGLVQTTEADIVETAGFLVNALSSKKKRIREENLQKFLIRSADLFIGMPTGIPINNIYRQGAAAVRIMKEF
jgi:hypothetical protein